MDVCVGGAPCSWSRTWIALGEGREEEEGKGKERRREKGRRGGGKREGEEEGKGKERGRGMKGRRREEGEGRGEGERGIIWSSLQILEQFRMDLLVGRVHYHLLLRASGCRCGCTSPVCLWPQR